MRLMNLCEIALQWCDKQSYLTYLCLVIIHGFASQPSVHQYLCYLSIIFGCSSVYLLVGFAADLCFNLDHHQ